MKSGKQRRVEIVAKRKQLAVKRTARASAVKSNAAPSKVVPVNEELLAPNNSYGAPDFVRREYYVDRPFRCVIAAKKKFGPARSRSGGMRSPKASLIPAPSVAARAGVKNESGERRRAKFT